MALSPWGVLATGAILLSAPAGAQTSWLVYGGSAQHTGVAGEALPAPLSVSWKYASDYQKDNTASPIVDGGTIYFASKDRLYAIRADSGELIWKSPSGDQPGTTLYRSTPAVANGTVYVGGSDGGMYALDARNGSQKWRFLTGATVRSHPLVDDGVLYFGSDDDFIYAIDANTGELRWKFHATDDVLSAPTFASDSNELLYFASTDGHLFAVNRLTGKLKWSARTPAASGTNSVVAYETRVYLAAGTQIYAFRSRSGVLETILPVTPPSVPEADITCTPVFTTEVGGDSRPLVYFGDRAGNFYCFVQARTVWKPVWKQKLDGAVTAMPVLAGSTVFVGAAKGFVYGLNSADGGVQWRYRLEAPLDLRTKYKYFNINAPLVVADQRLLVLGDDGTLNAFGPDGIDVAGPVITQPRPARGTTINGLPPINISASLWDAGTGIKPDTVVLKLDGQPMDVSKIKYNERRGLKPGVVYDPVQQKIEYNTPPSDPGQNSRALANGRHMVEVDAVDWKGNPTSLEWSFTVDNTLPVRPRVQPGTPGQPGAPGGYGTGPGGYGQRPGGYGNQPYGTPGQRTVPTPRRRPVRGGTRQPNTGTGTGYGAPGYAGGRS
jgi:outer membrane protein assembly factor BamB